MRVRPRRKRHYVVRNHHREPLYILYTDPHADNHVWLQQTFAWFEGPFRTKVLAQSFIDKHNKAGNNDLSHMQ